MSGFNKSRRAGLIGASVVLLFVFIFLLLIDARAFRHSFVRNLQECGIAQMEHLPQDADLIMIGSSRYRWGLRSEHIEQASNGTISRAFNFGRTGTDVARSYVTVRDILAAGVRPKYILVEVDLNSLKTKAPKSQRVSFHDPGFLTSKDTLMIWNAYGQEPLPVRAQAVAQEYLLKIKSSLIALFSGVYIRAAMDAPDQAPTVCWADRFGSQKEKGQRSVVRNKAYYTKLYGDLNTAEDDGFELQDTVLTRYNLYFLNEIRTLATAHGVKVLFGSPSVVYRPPYSAAALDRIRAVLPEFIFPEPEVVREMWSGFYDYRHMDEPSRLIHSAWLGQLIAKMEAAQ